MVETLPLHMTYLGDGISTDEDFEEEPSEEGGPSAPPPSEDEAPQGDGPLESPEEV